MKKYKEKKKLNNFIHLKKKKSFLMLIILISYI
jgi:hypothetical protein